MDVTNKLQKTVNDPEKTVASHGDSDPNPPGAFPETPMESSQDSGKQHNKLHKSNDPRGWSESERQAQGYGLGDSSAAPETTPRTQAPGDSMAFDNALGSGAHRGISPPKNPEYKYDSTNRDPNTTSSVLEGGQQPFGQDDSSRNTHGSSTTGAAGLSSVLPSREHKDTTNTSSDLSGRQHTSGHEDSSRDTHGSEKTGAAGLLSKVLPSRDHKTDESKHHEKSTDDKTADTSNDGKAPPYWGDLPIGGAASTGISSGGVYNTVTGHGSGEPTQHASGTTHNTETDRTQNPVQHLSGTAYSATGHGSHDNTGGPTYNTVTGHGSREGDSTTSGAGGGVYNTITGHGSREDESSRHHDFSALPTSSDNVSSSRTHGSNTQTEPLGTTTGRDNTASYTRERPDQPIEEKDSHLKEKLAGGALAGGAGAYAYDQHNKSRDNTEPRSEQPHTEEKKEKKGLGSLFGLGGSKSEDKHKEKEHKEKDHKEKEHKDHSLTGLLHRGSKEKDERKDERDVRDNRTHGAHDEKKPLTEHDKAFAAAGARTAFGTHSDNTQQRATSGQHNDPLSSQRGDNYDHLSSGTTSGVQTGGSHQPSHTLERSAPVDNLRERDQHDSSDRSKYAAAGLGAAGLGAGAYALHSRGQDDERNTRGENPLSSTTGTGQYNTGSDSLTGNRDSSAPISSGAYASSTNPLGGNSESHGSVLGSSGLNTQSSNPLGGHQDSQNTAFGSSGANTTSANPLSGNRDSHNTAFGATSANLLSGHHDSQNTAFGTSGSNTTSSNPLGGSHNTSNLPLGSSTNTSSTREPFQQGGNTVGPAVEESAPIPPMMSTSQHGHGAEHSSTTGHTGSATEHKPTSALTEHANKGDYNVLSSGTPSGVKIDDDVQTKPSSSTTTGGVSGLHRSEEKDSHRGTAAGVLGAAGLGAGAGAYARRPDEDEKARDNESKRDELRRDEPLKRDTPIVETHDKDSKPGFLSGAGSSLPTSGKPVIHKCHKCGEDNDISSYFNSDKRSGH